MAISSGDDDEIIASINVTPLVDITLVLLIIFMVTATYIVAPSIKVELPKAASGDDTRKSTLAIVLTKERALYLNGRPTTEDALARAVQAASAGGQDPQAIISADKEVTHGAVIRVIDLVKLNGVSKFALNIDPEVARAAGPLAGSSPVSGGG